MDLSLALGERVAAGRVRVNPRESLLKMAKLPAAVEHFGKADRRSLSVTL